MKKLFDKKFIMDISITGAVILIEIIAIFLFSSNIESNATEIRNSNQEIQSRAIMLESLAVLREDAKNSEEYSEALGKMLPERDELFSFSRDLEDLAKSDSIDLSFSFGAEVPGNDQVFGQINFTLIADGSYLDLMRFLKHIEEKYFIIKTDSFDLTKKSEDQFRILLRGRVLFR